MFVGCIPIICNRSFRIYAKPNERTAIGSEAQTGAWMSLKRTDTQSHTYKKKNIRGKKEKKMLQILLQKYKHLNQTLSLFVYILLFCHCTAFFNLFINICLINILILFCKIS